jgi:hypothetical protein
MISSTIRRTLVAGVGVLSMAGMGLGTVAASAASASTVPVCTSQQLVTGLTGAYGPVSIQANGDKVYKIRVVNKGARCMLKAADPGVYTPGFRGTPFNTVAHAAVAGYTPYAVTLAKGGAAEAKLVVANIPGHRVGNWCWFGGHWVYAPFQSFNRLFVTLPDSNGGVHSVTDVIGINVLFPKGGFPIGFHVMTITNLYGV